MAMTNAEKQLGYRERRDQDPDRKRQHQANERAAYVVSQHSAIQMYYIEIKDIQDSDKDLKKIQLATIEGTMDIHQVT